MKQRDSIDATRELSSKSDERVDTEQKDKTHQVCIYLLLGVATKIQIILVTILVKLLKFK